MIEILYEDGEALVINKPAGLPIEKPRRGGQSLADHLDALRLGFKRQPIPVHRLDTDTSGCLLLARNPKALKRFNKAFEDRLVTKVYCGIIGSVPKEREGRIELALTKISSEEKGWRMIPAKKGKPSVTDWSVRSHGNAKAGGRALIEFRPTTGRTHQIRVHAASGLGQPLLGDPVYGNRKSASRTMLHAESLIIKRDGKPDIVAHAPMPQDFINIGFKSDIEAAAAAPADMPADCTAQPDEDGRSDG